MTNSNDLSQLTARLGRAIDVIDLRHKILRAGLPRAAAVFEGDDEATTLHALAEIGGRIVGVATLLRRPWNESPAWQLRGMAVEDGLRGLGIGFKLLALLENRAANAGFSRQLWCNARTPALAFYQKCGWAIASEEFVIETAGPHRKMTRTLA